MLFFSRGAASLLLSAALAVAAVLTTPDLSTATEAAMGRHLPGAFAAPTVGVVPPPGMYWSANTIYYKGSTGADLQVPVAAWEEGALDNVGMNYWTFSPTLAFTHLDMTHGLDLSFIAGVDINTENPDTDYLSGALAHLDASLMKAFGEQFAVGILGAGVRRKEPD